MGYITLKYHHATGNWIQGDFVDVKFCLFAERKFMKLHGAAWIDKAKSSSAGIGLYVVRPAEHGAGMRMGVVTMVQLLVNIGEKRRDSWLAVTEVQSQQGCEVIHVLKGNFLQVLCPRCVDEPVSWMREIGGPNLIVERA